MLESRYTFSADINQSLYQFAFNISNFSTTFIVRPYSLFLRLHSKLPPWLSFFRGRHAQISREYLGNPSMESGSHAKWCIDPLSAFLLMSLPIVMVILLSLSSPQTQDGNTPRECLTWDDEYSDGDDESASTSTGEVSDSSSPSNPTQPNEGDGRRAITDHLLASLYNTTSPQPQPHQTPQQISPSPSTPRALYHYRWTIHLTSPSPHRSYTFPATSVQNSSRNPANLILSSVSGWMELYSQDHQTMTPPFEMVHIDMVPHPERWVVKLSDWTEGVSRNLLCREVDFEGARVGRMVLRGLFRIERPRQEG